MSLIEEIQFSWKRDYIVWYIMAISIVGLFLCKTESDIQWWPIIFEVRDIFEAIYSSSVAGCIFYIMVNAMPLYKSRQARLSFIRDSLSDMIRILKEGHGLLENNCNFNKINDCNIILNENVRMCLIKDGVDVRNLTNNVILYIDILSPKDIKLFNSIITNKTFLRYYYSQFDETFNQCKVCLLLHMQTELIANLETLRDKIDNLIN